MHHIVPPFPRSYKGKFHILFAHARQLHLTLFLLSSRAQEYDVFFVDQLSTCIPFLRILVGKRVVFYCHFPDKLLANGAYVEGNVQRKNVSLLKRIYRYPMDWMEEVTTSTSNSFYSIETVRLVSYRTSRCYSCQFRIYCTRDDGTFFLADKDPQSCIPGNQHRGVPAFMGAYEP